MSCDMAQGEGLEPMNGLYGEGAGESWLSLLSHPAENPIQIVALPSSKSSVLPSLFWPCGVEKSMWTMLSIKMSGTAVILLYFSLVSYGAVGCFY